MRSDTDWGFWRWIRESQSFMAHKPRWQIAIRAALKWPAFDRQQRRDNVAMAQRPWHATLNRWQRRRLARRLDRAFWRAAFRPPRSAADPKYGDEGVLEDLDLAARDLERRR